MKVVLYSRVSTDEQANSGLSLEAQNTKLRAYADLYELEVVAAVEDAGESAKTLKRPGLQQALEMLRSGATDGFAVTKLDRLTRSVGDWQRLIDEFFGERAGKALFSVADSIDTTTAGGRLVLNVLLSVAQWEREAIAERTKDALQSKIAKGERVGSVRYGYRVGDDGKTLIAVENEQNTIDLIKRLRFDRGLSYRKIGDELNRQGILTKSGKSIWTHTTVASVIKLNAPQRPTAKSNP